MERLQQLHLLEPEELQELPRLRTLFPDDSQLLNQLLKRQWITRFQAHLLLQGKGRKLLFGSYVLIDLLGSGGMGRVFKARNWKFGRIVSLKIVKPELLTRPEAVRRFYREVRAFAQLDHPHIVRAYDATDYKGIHSVAMEYIEGFDLSHLIAKQGAIPFQTAMSWIRQAALGLDHAHQRGILHRDIKPSNLLLDSRTNLIKLTDLGLARLFDAPQGESATLTGMGRLLGTPDFIAPEQVRNAHEVDERADIYSLGCTAYFLLAGNVPFPGGTPTDKMLRHLTESPTPLTHFRRDLPFAACELIARMMSKRVIDRPATAAEVVAEIDRVIHLPADAHEHHSSLSSTINTVENHPTLAPTMEVNVDEVWVPQEMEEAAEAVADDLLPTHEAPEPYHRPRSQYLVLSGMLFCLLALGIIIADRPAPQPTPSVQSHPTIESADQYWADLQLGLTGSYRDLAGYRKELLAFQHRFYDHPHALTAAQLLHDLPCPLDDLPTLDRLNEGWPHELIAQWKWLDGRWHGDVVGSPPRATIPPETTNLVLLDDGRRFLAGVSGHPAQIVSVFGDIPAVSAGVTLNDPGELVGSSTSHLVMAPKDDHLQVWNPLQDLAYPPIEATPSHGKLAAFHPDSQRVIVALDHPYPMVRVYDLRSQQCTLDIEIGSTVPQALTVSPTGHLIAIADQRQLRVVSIHDVTHTQSWGFTDQQSISAMVFSPNGRTLYSIGGNGNLLTWDPSGDSDVRVWPGHAQEANSLSISPNGQYLATSSVDGELIIWRADSCEKWLRFRLPSPIVLSRFSPCSRYLFTAHSNGTIGLFRLRGG